MFSFIKKGAGSSGGGGNGSTSATDKEEKERRKKEKKERKEKEKKEKCSMTADDLLRLDEVKNFLNFLLLSLGIYNFIRLVFKKWKPRTKGTSFFMISGLLPRTNKYNFSSPKMKSVVFLKMEKYPR